MKTQFIACSFLIVLAACEKTDDLLIVEPPPVITGVEVLPAIEAVAVHDTLRLTARVFTTSNRVLESSPVAWSTSDATIATVDGTGLVRALREGTVLVTGSAERFADTASLNLYRMLTFSSDRSGRYEVYTISANGKHLRKFTQNMDGAFNAVWSPDRTRVAVTMGSRIVVMNADGSNVFTIANSAATPTWSPDGQKLAFLANDPYPNQEIHVINVDGGGRTNISRSPAMDHSPTWSPDGSRIAFVSDREGSTQIYAMNPDGTSLRKLTSIPASHNLYPAWSPDGTRIAFVSALYNGGDGGWGIYTMDPNGGNRTRIHGGNSADPAWSPDGRFIAFMGFVDGQQDIYIMNADGTNARKLTDDAAFDQAPAWR